MTLEQVVLVCKKILKTYILNQIAGMIYHLPGNFLSPSQRLNRGKGLVRLLSLPCLFNGNLVRPEQVTQPSENFKGVNCSKALSI